MFKKKLRLMMAMLGCVAASGAFAAGTNPAPSAESAMKVLEASPRHGEYVHVPLAGTETKIKSWVVYPERKEKAPVVLVIHEIFGLSDWVRSVADALAAEGFIAIAPDLLSGMDGAEANPREAISNLTDEEAIKRLNAVLDYGVALPAANGKAASIGFCWGGRMSFLYASAQPKLSGAVVYYGTSPDAAALEKLTVPVIGFYGEDDARVNATIPDAEVKMKELGKPYEPVILKGAGHGFLRQQDGKEGANLKASEEAWPKTLEFLKSKTS